jgi:hypothetical protein
LKTTAQAEPHGKSPYAELGIRAFFRFFSKSDGKRASQNQAPLFGSKPKTIPDSKPARKFNT